ncbi:MAG: hypothetical protein NT092_10245 [Bacteroidia bacterium]|nr:hypothetical protein [Bacteroidia bacterium]
MKSLNIYIACIILFLFSLQLFSQEEPDKRNVWSGGQKGYVITGDLSVVKDQKTFNIIVDPHIKKMGAKEEPDSVYIPKRVKEFNAEIAGKGDQWLEKWNESQKNFKAAFIEGFNSKLKSKGINVGLNDTMAEYTFIIYTKNHMEFMGGVYIIVDMDVVKTSDPNTKVASIRCPLNNSNLKSKQFKGQSERAYFGAGVLFSKYCIKNIF